MFRNYLKIAFRNLLKKKFYSFINILGLAIGMACCLLITLYVLDELSYDRFHEKADRIYRVTTRTSYDGQEDPMASTNYHIAEVIDDEIPEIEASLRVQKLGNYTIKRNDELYPGNQAISADSNFFDIFTFPLLEGNPAMALKEPASVVLTEALAQKLFGHNKGLIGETLVIHDKVYQVTGIAENPPHNAHFHFDLIVPFQPRVSEEIQWFNVNGYVSTYFLLHQGASVAAIPDKLYQLMLKYDSEAQQATEQGYSAEFFVQPLTAIHLHSHLNFEMEPNGNIQYVYVFSVIALFVLMVALVNYVNLATARSADRAKEIGVRKTLGSARGTLIKQFLTESTLTSLLAMLIGLGLAEVFRRPFNALADKQLTLNVFENTELGVLILIFALAAGFIAGIYPAFSLTRFQPIQVLRGKLTASRSGRQFRHTLVVFQFVTSIGLIICTGLVYQQLQYMQSKQLGYDKENVILLPNGVEAHYDAFMNAVKNHPQVISATASSQSPHEVTNSQGVGVKGQEEGTYPLNRLFIDYDFLSTFHILLKEGRDFSRMIASDTAAVVINEAAVRKLGLEKPLQAQLDITWEAPFEVVGVVEDFHFQSLHEEITPLFMILDPSRRDYHVLEIRITGEDIPGTLAFLEETWQQFSTDDPFNYSFLDQDYEALYRAEQQLGTVFSIFSGLAIFVACLGLLALAAFTAEQRTKEIGIRKVMGASIKDIVVMLSGNFTKLVLIAFLIAIPLAYVAMQRWLQDFAYRIDVNAWTFIAAGVLAILIAWLTTSFQAVKAARSNPVDALRYE